MQPYTPHGDSNKVWQSQFADTVSMQPYTPHGDSNRGQSRPGPGQPLDATLYPARGQQQFEVGVAGHPAEDATLYPARGQQPLRRDATLYPARGMQPYTPHGDSNYARGYIEELLRRDATLYPARGQQL